MYTGALVFIVKKKKRKTVIHSAKWGISLESSKSKKEPVVVCVKTAQM